jgi:hypothetical protein
MNAYISAFLRQLTCATAAILISVVVSMSFVQSTATAPGAHAPTGTARVANA